MSIEPKNEKNQGEELDSSVEKADILHQEVLANDVLMLDAIDGENEEHQMSMWMALKTHP
jgi:SP family general alpha glucoside:H+ symporter-like MFS transporter